MSLPSPVNKMSSIVTITMNPAVDKSVRVNQVIPNHKLRAEEAAFEPGGGGINVSRVLKRLGAESLAIFPSGGYTGKLLQELLLDEKINHEVVEINNWTRENFMAVDNLSGQQFRFIINGPEMTMEEGTFCLDKLQNLTVKPDFIVASGSLAPGLPCDFYARIARISESLGAEFILDTSGEPLLEAAKEKIFLLKPNLSELSKMAGVEILKTEMILEAAKDVIKKGRCRMLAVSLGSAGALIVSGDYSERIAAPPVHIKSTVGAGDSMVAGMVLCLSQGKSFQETIRFGVACGTATTMNSGTELCKKEDIENLYNWINCH